MNILGNKHRHGNATVVYQRFQPMARKRIHALKGLACRKRVAVASSPAATCKQGAALTSHARHASVTEVIKYCPTGPKLRHTAVTGNPPNARHVHMQGKHTPTVTNLIDVIPLHQQKRGERHNEWNAASHRLQRKLDRWRVITRYLFASDLLPAHSHANSETRRAKRHNAGMTRTCNLA
jgi:hypothetical protein